MEKSVNTIQEQILTIYCKILVIRNGQYLEIVVEDLNRSPTDDLKYVTVVRLPNWDTPNNIKIGDKGYLQFKWVKGGITQWFDKDVKDFKVYNYTNNYFINFFKEKDKCEQDKFKLE